MLSHFGSNPDPEGEDNVRGDSLSPKRSLRPGSRRLPEVFEEELEPEEPPSVGPFLDDYERECMDFERED